MGAPSPVKGRVGGVGGGGLPGIGPDRGREHTSGRPSGRGHEPVAQSPDRLHLRAVLSELLAHFRDVNVHGPRLARKVGAPHVLEQGVARQDDAGVAREGGEQVELSGAELEPALANGGLTPAGIDTKVADGDRPAALGRHVGPTQDRLHPRHEGPRIERLGHVVVRAKLQTDDRVDVLRPCGQHEYRNVTAPAKLPADLEAIHLGQHQVQHHQVRVAALVLDQGLLAVGRGHHGVAVFLEVEPDQLDDVALVVDDEDGLHEGRIRPVVRMPAGRM